MDSEPRHCGACDNSCLAGEVCSLGMCGTECVGGTVPCGDRCVDPTFDPLHCGGCDQVCPEGEVCSEGQCGISCLGGTTLCNAGCVDTQVDPGHCGACNMVCPNDEVCVAGSCQLECVGGSIKCGRTCVDTQHDPGHCGGCNMPCSVAANQIAACANGMCNAFCNAGFGDCNMESGDGCEVDLGTSVTDCGACGKVCDAANASVKCTTGSCELDACTVGYADCDNVYNTGCEVDTQTDANNCGVCGKVCGNGQVCMVGVCVDTSNPVTFEESFLNGQTPTAQCGVWNTWRGNLTATFSKMTVYGTFNTTGISCTDATVVNNFAAALKNNTTYTANCDGNSWSLCDRYTGELWLNPPTECSGSNCPNGYIVRPCIGNTNWGGVNTATCGGASQTMGVRFE